MLPQAQAPAPVVTAGAAPPAPPMFGQQGQTASKPASAQNSGFSSTVLGTGGNPSNTGQKTLLGQ